MALANLELASGPYSNFSDFKMLNNGPALTVPFILYDVFILYLSLAHYVVSTYYGAYSALW